ncbi:MAG TPA: arginase family protein [Tahibacter sp.]|nr:arginase family protein [Tahibacter sp.]
MPVQPVILDLDGSVQLDGAEALDRRDWQETLRFACSRRALDRFDATLPAELGRHFAPVFFGSGDFHHLSLPLIRRVAGVQPCRVVVFDNHPDNMRFLAGVHCGSWVSHAAALPGVLGIDVVGITSKDVDAAHLWENRWSPLRRGRVRYWCIGAANRWAARLGLGHAFRAFPDAPALMTALLAQWQSDTVPVYLSIDKDVLHPDDAHTNWDQGVLRAGQLCAAIRMLAPRLVGMDVNGEVSSYVYRRRWKRWLSAVDEQPAIPVEQVQRWQTEQAALNRRLLAALSD